MEHDRVRAQMEELVSRRTTRESCASSSRPAVLVAPARAGPHHVQARLRDYHLQLLSLPPVHDALHDHIYEVGHVLLKEVLQFTLLHLQGAEFQGIPKGSREEVE